MEKIMRSTKRQFSLYYKYLDKIYFQIDQHFVYYFEYLSSLPPFLCSQIITSFLNSIIFTNLEKGFVFSLIMKPLYSYYFSSIEFLLLIYCVVCIFSSYYDRIYNSLVSKHIIGRYRLKGTRDRYTSRKYLQKYIFFFIKMECLTGVIIIIYEHCTND